MTISPVLTAWQTGDTGALAATVSDDVVFSSPVADYRGRDAALHILGLIAAAIEEPRPIHVRSGDGDAFHRFVAQVRGSELQGVLHEERDPAGRLVHITLFLRPYSVLRTAMGTMRRLLESSPLPAQPE